MLKYTVVVQGDPAKWGGVLGAHGDISQLCLKAHTELGWWLKQVSLALKSWNWEVVVQLLTALVPLEGIYSVTVLPRVHTWMWHPRLWFGWEGEESITGWIWWSQRIFQAQWSWDFPPSSLSHHVLMQLVGMPGWLWKGGMWPFQNVSRNKRTFFIGPLHVSLWKSVGIVGLDLGLN